MGRNATQLDAEKLNDGTCRGQDAEELFQLVFYCYAQREPPPQLYWLAQRLRRCVAYVRSLVESHPEHFEYYAKRTRTKSLWLVGLAGRRDEWERQWPRRDRGNPKPRVHVYPCRVSGQLPGPEEPCNLWAEVTLLSPTRPAVFTRAQWLRAGRQREVLVMFHDTRAIARKAWMEGR